MNKYLIFGIQNLEFGIQLDYIERVSWVVETLPLPYSDPDLLGLVNVQGEIIPIINIRKVLQLSDKAVDLEDKFVIFRHENKPFILLVDSLHGVFTSSKDDKMDQETPIFLNKEIIQSIIKNNNKLIYIIKIEKFFDVLTKNEMKLSN